MFFDKDYGLKGKTPCFPPKKEECPQLPGTLIRINIPAGAVINLLNLIEVSSPAGICLIVRIPLLAGSCGTSWQGVLDAIHKAGGTVEFTN